MKQPPPGIPVIKILSSATLLLSMMLSVATQKPRARDIGLHIGILPTGQWNAITDVPGVKVGHTTLNQGDSVHTGVTAILPHDGNIFQQKVPAAIFVGNGFGKLAGTTQVQELGNIETPIVLTNTLSVGLAVTATVEYTLSQKGNEGVYSVNAVVGELATPAENILKGVIRGKVLQLARASYAVIQRPVTLDDIWDAREAFITSTTKHIIPVVQVDGRAVGDGGPGRITRQLRRDLDGMVSSVTGLG